MVKEKACSLDFPAPQFGTPRTDRPTYGGDVAALAARLGWSLMPWQQHVADVSLEYDPDTGEMAYETVVLMVPRQNGKSSLVMAIMFWRLLKFQRQNVVYTAQELKLARKKWKREMLPRLRAVQLLQEDRDYHVSTSSGNEAIEFFETDSLMTLSAVGEEAGHSDTNHMVVLDEAFAHRSHDVDQGFLPTMATVWSPQLWVTSTAGKAKSVYLNHSREIGRQAVAEGKTEGVCHIEWVAPDDCDHLDPRVWRCVMPSLKSVTTGGSITEKRIRDNFAVKMPETDFRRAFLNQTDMGDEGTQSEITPTEWAQGTDPESFIEGRAMVGVAVTPNRAEASIAIAGIRADGHLHVDHVKTGAGTGWVVDDVATVISNWPGVEGVAFDGGGPASALKWGELPVQALSVREFGQACAAVADGVGGGGLFHRGQVEFADAVARLQVRPLGDLWLPRRGDGDGSVAAFEAAAVAVGGLTKSDEPAVVGDSPTVKRGGLFRWD